MKHRGRNVRIWNCFTLNGTELFQLIKGSMNGIVDQYIPNKNLFASFKALKIKYNWVFLQDNDPKYTAKQLFEYKN